MKKIMLVMLLGLITACTTNNIQVDFTTWGEDEVYKFLTEVQENVRKIPVETNSRDQIIEQYGLYFSPELSKEIVDSSYVKTESGWKIPDGDAGYIFFVPSRGTEGSEVTIEYERDYITISETYEFGMFKEIEYSISNSDNKPKITEWKRIFD